MKNKLHNTKSVGITAYDYPFAKIFDPIVDFLVVGDTVGTTVHGYNDMNKVDMNMMVTHCKAVSKGASLPFLIGDMPYMSYQTSNKTAIENAGRFISEGGMDAVKIEGYFPDRVNAVDSSGTLVMGHLGLTPQTKARLGGYKIQAKTYEEIKKLIKQCTDIQDAGAKLLLLEAVPNDVGDIIQKELQIPVYGIGAGKNVDGQLVISHDILGMFWKFKPKFVKRYVNCEKIISDAVKEYSNEVRSGTFPSEDFFYNIKHDEIEKYLSNKNWKHEII